MAVPPADGESPRESERGPETTMTFGMGAVEIPDVDDAGISEDERLAIEALPAGCALLLVQRGPNTGSRFLLDSVRTTAGRQPESDIFLDDVTVSRKHAEFVREGDGFRVRDVGSLNGTYVNRQRIDEAVLRAGDEVQIGKFRMVYRPSRRGGGQAT